MPALFPPPTRQGGPACFACNPPPLTPPYLTPLVSSVQTQGPRNLCLTRPYHTKSPGLGPGGLVYCPRAYTHDSKLSP